MFNETCTDKVRTTVTLRDYNYPKEYRVKYSLPLCAMHLSELGWAATVWTEQKA
jgi:hypothetical protein